MRLALGMLAAAAGGLAFMAKRGLSGPRQDRVEHARPPADSDGPTAQSQPHRAAPHPSPDQQAAARDERHKRGERIYWGVTGLMSVVATGAAIVAALFAMDAYKETRRQAEAALAANEISRATLEAAVSSSVHFTQSEFRLHTDADEAPRIHVVIPVGNDGGTTTRGLTYSAVCAVSTEVPADPFNRARLKAARRYSLTLAPKQTLRPTVCSYSAPEWGFLIGAKADLFVYGQATYRDTVNATQTHTVEFCTRLYDLRFSGSPFNPGPFAMGEECERHNCRDEECAEQRGPPSRRADPAAL